MARIKNKQVNTEKNKKVFLDDLLNQLTQQTLTLIISFIFTTAFIGGCGYVLFQFPNELSTIEKSKLELEVKQRQIDDFNKMGEITAKGWLLDENELAHFHEIENELYSNIFVEKVDQTFLFNTSSWISGSLVRISTERGKINSYKFDGEFEQSIQKSIVDAYDLRSNILNQIEEMIRYWDRETLAEKEKRLEFIKASYLNISTNLSEVFSKIEQVQSHQELICKECALEESKITTVQNIAYLKFILSILGVVLGAWLFFFLAKESIKKYDLK